MTQTQYDAAPRRKRARAESEPPVGVPSDVMLALRHGGTAALACAAASSAVSLFWLAVLVGWPKPLAWLLPASLDVYAGVSLYVGYRLPVLHPASVSARRNARLGLALSVGCNGIYHALVLFGGAWPAWVHDSLLVAVSALPPIVVERVLHLNSKVGNGPANATTPVRAPANAAAPSGQPSAPNANAQPPANPALAPNANGERRSSPGPATPPANGEPPRTSTPANPQPRPAANGATGTDTWIELAHPLYTRLRDAKREAGLPATKTRPTVPELLEAINTRIAELVDAGTLPETARGGMSDSNVKKLRLELENRFPDLTPLIHEVAA